MLSRSRLVGPQKLSSWSYTKVVSNIPHLIPLAGVLPRRFWIWALLTLPPQLTHPVQGPNADLGSHQGHCGVRGLQLHALPEQRHGVG